jgi:hypothetical protein
VPLLFPTNTDNGGAEEDDISAPVGTALAVSTTTPLVDGCHEHVTEKLDPDPVVILFLQEGIITFLALKVTFDATLTFAVITIDVLYVAPVAEPASANELNEEASTTSVTAIVID